MATLTPPSGTSQIAYITVTIASGASLSEEADLRGRVLVGIVMPATWTAASLTFQSAIVTAGTFNDFMAPDGTEYTVTATAADDIPIPPGDFLSVDFLKVRSGTSAAAVNQGGDRVITLKVMALT